MITVCDLFTATLCNVIPRNELTNFPVIPQRNVETHFSPSNKPFSY